MIRRSKRPGRVRAGSRTSGRLVAAIKMTPEFGSKPSISTSNWLRVCSRSSCPPPKSGAAMTTNGVDFVNENNRRTMRFGLIEQVAHARSADADEHFHEVRAGNMEERHARFARNGARQAAFCRCRDCRAAKRRAEFSRPAPEIFRGFSGSR